MLRARYSSRDLMTRIDKLARPTPILRAVPALSVYYLASTRHGAPDVGRPMACLAGDT